MYHAFDVSIAMKYSVDEAIFLQHIEHWVRFNAINKKNYFEGNYWTFNAHKTFTKFFPYWSSRQIERIINNLINSELLLKNKFNRKNYDHTNWYALSKKGLELFPSTYELIKNQSDDEKGKNNDKYEDLNDSHDHVDHSTQTRSPIPSDQHTSNKQKNLNNYYRSDQNLISSKELIDAYHEALPEAKKIRVASLKLQSRLKTLQRDWPRYADGKQFSIESFTKFLHAIRDYCGWMLKPYQTESGNTKKNGLEFFIRDETITKIINQDY